MSFDMRIDASSASWMQGISEKGPKRACGWQKNSHRIIRDIFILWIWRKTSSDGPPNSMRKKTRWPPQSMCRSCVEIDKQVELLSPVTAFDDRRNDETEGVLPNKCEWLLSLLA